MQLYPAIDLLEGKVVRLQRGDYSQATVYSEKPAEFAVKWAAAGAKWLHVVDLEGAKTGELKNLSSLKAICQAAGCQIQFGGGLRTEKQIEEILTLGVDRVVVGTKALDDQFLAQILKSFKRQVAVSLDVKEGMVQTQGWIKSTGVRLEQAITHLNWTPLQFLIYTDIQKDGMLQGPNVEGLKAVLAKAKARVILSGGISSLEDIKELRKIKRSNFEGAIMGKALYEGKVDLKEALAL